MQVNRRQEAYDKAIAAQHVRQEAEIEVGSAEGYLYEARKAAEPEAVEDARRKLRRARGRLHAAIDVDRAAYSYLLAVEEELDRKIEQRRAARLRKQARVVVDARS